MHPRSDQAQPGAPQCRLRGTELDHHGAAVRPLVDQSLHAPDLTLDPPQPGEDVLCGFLGEAHRSDRDPFDRCA